MLFRPARRVALAALIVLGLATPAAACTCADLPPVETAFAWSTAVFTGIPRSITLFESPYLYGRAVTFEVTAVWKGEVPAEFVVFTGSGGADCGIDFDLDVEWLVYTATGPLDPWDPKGPAYHEAGSCSRTGHARNHPDLDWLGLPPSTPAATSSWGALKAHFR